MTSASQNANKFNIIRRTKVEKYEDGPLLIVKNKFLGKLKLGQGRPCVQLRYAERSNTQLNFMIK